MTMNFAGSSGLVRCLALGLSVFMLSPAAYAQSTKISEAAILQAAVQASPAYQSVYKDAAFEKADAEQAGKLANPTVELGAVRTTSRADDTNSYDVEIEQPLKFSQMTGKRSALSNALYQQAELREQHGLLQAYWNAKTLYAKAWQAQEKTRLYTDFQKRAQEISRRIEKFVAAGQSPVSEGSLFTGDAAKFGSDLEKIKTEEQLLRLQLEKATGINLTNAELAKPSLLAFNTDVSQLEAHARQNASLVRLLEADLQAAERQRQAASADSFVPEIAPRFIYGRNPDDDEESVGVGVVLTIPLWDQNQTERKKANAAKQYAQRQLDSLQALPLSERLKRISETLDQLDRRIVALEKEALPNYRKAFTQAQKSFNAGQTDAAALWQIRERLFDSEQEALQAILDAVEARHILSLETGALPQEVTQ